MFKSISGGPIGIFREPSCFEHSPEFKRYNVIYGFNGTGKSTLSRVFNSAAAGRIDTSLPSESVFMLHGEAPWQFETDKDTTPNSNVLVFNSDFVSKHLFFDKGGAAEIVYLGNDVGDLLAQLQSTRKQIEQVSSELVATQKICSAAQVELVTSKRELAKQVKSEANMHPYDARHLDARMSSAGTERLEALELENCRATCRNEEALASVEQLPNTFNVSSWLVQVEEALLKEPLLTVVDDLIGKEVAYSWLARGLSLHADLNSTSCLFCSNDFTDDRVEQLRGLLGDAYKKLALEVSGLRDFKSSHSSKLRDLRAMLPGTTGFYIEFQKDVDEARNSIAATIENLQTQLAKVVNLLDKKAKISDKSVSSPELFIELLKGSKELSDKLDNFNDLIGEHNLKSSRFDEEKKRAQYKVEGHVIEAFSSSVKNAIAKQKSSSEALQNKSNILEALRNKEQSLLQQTKDTGQAAVKINSMLKRYLGHEELTMEIRESGYIIKRKGGDYAKVLSEGEKTAIALCYFLSKINEEGKRSKERVVVIDDPVSSLDSKARNFAFALIQSECKDCKQLFLLTHNIHFLNEAKKWLRGRASSTNSRGVAKDPSAMFFAIESAVAPVSGLRVSKLSPMPDLLSQYDSEYHYLFSIVYTCSLPPVNGLATDHYIVPNLIRKVLETFFAFKAPKAQSYAAAFEHKIVQEANVPNVDIAAMRRLSEVESHGQSLAYIDSLSENTYEEATNAAITCMKLIEAIDPNHFKEMSAKC